MWSALSTTTAASNESGAPSDGSACCRRYQCLGLDFSVWRAHQRDLDLALQGGVELYTSQPIIEELRGVLQEKFHWSTERVEDATETLLRFCRLIDPGEPLKVCRDPDDDRVLECALAAGAEVIVSGDRDLLDLGTFRETPIMSPRRFLDSGFWKR